VIICGDALTELRKLPGESINMCCSSPPYWGLRDYGTAAQIWGDDGTCLVHPNPRGDTEYGLNHDWMENGFCTSCKAWRGSLGLEPTPELYVSHLVEVFREVRRVLRKDGSLWLNMGDSYCSGNRGGYDRNRAGASKNMGQNASDFHAAPNRMPLPGLKDKDLVGIPWRIAFALQADGWWLRQDIIWSKLNPMPESVRDRCTKSHEYIFMFSKNGRTILWRAKDTLEWSYKPDLSEILGHDDKGKPIKRWMGFTYYYDAEAVKEPGVLRFDDRPFGNAGGNRHGDEGRVYSATKIAHDTTYPGYQAPGQTVQKGNRKTDKQRGHGRRHAGFNDRWDSMDKAEQCSVMRNLRSVWTIATRPYAEAHFATFPPEIPELCIKAGCPKGGTVLDPFFGAGTTGLVALRLGREFVGIDLSEKYCEMARKRIYGTLRATNGIREAP